MAFTLETWKEQVTERLWDWRLRLEQTKPKAVYAALSAMSLWPLVQAAQGDGFASTLMALASVAQGVGGNLIAEQIQRWRDEADTLSPDAVETWVQTHLADNAAVRDALHAIVEKVEAIEQAQAGLSEPERQWFMETLRRELTQVGAERRFEAHLWGSNNVLNQGDIQIPGNVSGDVLGPGSSKTTHYHYLAAPREDPSPPSAWQAYLSWVMSRVHAVPLAGIDPHNTARPAAPGGGAHSGIHGLGAWATRAFGRMPGIYPMSRCWDLWKFPPANSSWEVIVNRTLMLTRMRSLNTRSFYHNILLPDIQ